MQNMSSITEVSQYIETVKDDVQTLSVDDRVKIEQQNNNNYKVKTIVSSWEQQQNSDRFMRNGYAKVLMCVLAIQLLVINIIFVLIGVKVLFYEQWVINVFIISVFGEIASMVVIIVRYLFIPVGKDMINLIKDL